MRKDTLVFLLFYSIFNCIILQTYKAAEIENKGDEAISPVTENVASLATGTNSYR